MKVEDPRKKFFKSLNPETIANHGYLDKSPDGNFICPKCGNGSGEDGTGIYFSQKDGVYNAYCFKCGESVDYIDAAAKKFGLDATRDFATILDTVSKEFDLSEVDNSRAVHSKKNISPAYYQKSATDPANSDKSTDKFKGLIQSAQKNLCAEVDNLGGSWRGLPLDHLKKYMVGFLPRFGRFALPYFIIPTSYNHYLARLAIDVPAELEGKVKIKPHSGTKEIFNAKALLNPQSANSVFFVVEGEIDAMSIELLGFNAIALSGSDLTKHQKKWLKENCQMPKFIVLFDDDTTGDNKRAKVVKALNGLNFPTSTDTLSLGDGIKDANDALQKDPAALNERLTTIITDCQPLLEKAEKHILQIRAFDDCGRLTTDSVPDAPMKVAVPMNFIMADGGIYARTKTEYVPVTGTPLFVSKRYTTHDRFDSQIELTIKDRVHGYWYKHTLKMSDVADSRKILKLADFGVPITQKRASLLSTYIMDQIADDANISLIPTSEFYRQPGWIDDQSFIYPGEEGSDSFVACNNFDYEKAFATKGNRHAWDELLKKVWNASPGARVGLGLAAIAPALEKLGVRNPQLHFCGRSGSGKTALAKFLMSMYGDPNLLKQTFNSTQNYIDQLGPKFNGFPSWIDEYQSAPLRIRQNADNIIYNFENGVTKGRLDKEANDRPMLTFHGVRITTGEQPITNFASGQGAKSRVIEIDDAELLPNDLAVEIHRTMDTNPTFGHIGREIVKTIMSEPRIAAGSWQFYNQNYQSYIQHGYFPSHVQMIALAHTGLAVIGKIMGWNQDDICEIACNDFMKLTQNSNFMMTTTNADRALKMIIETKFNCRRQFQTVFADGSFSEAETGEALGVILRNGNVGFYARGLRTIIERTGFSSAESVINQLADEGVFIEGKSKDHLHMKSVSIDNARRWLYVIPKEYFDAAES